MRLVAARRLDREARPMRAIGLRRSIEARA